MTYWETFCCHADFWIRSSIYPPNLAGWSELLTAWNYLNKFWYHHQHLMSTCQPKTQDIEFDKKVHESKEIHKQVCRLNKTMVVHSLQSDTAPVQLQMVEQNWSFSMLLWLTWGLQFSTTIYIVKDSQRLQMCTRIHHVYMYPCARTRIRTCASAWMYVCIHVC